MKPAAIESVCVFGSCARGSADKLSDRDILLISNNSQRARELRTVWANQGWSVSAYTPSRFERMCDSGSLFVQHIKLEGNILLDKGGWLETKLQASRLKKSYLQDAVASAELALPMERFHGDDLICNHLIAADLGYVALRNFGICYLSSTGGLYFDYVDIVTRLAEEFQLNSRETRLLQDLRVGKVSYRNGVDCRSFNGSVGELRSVLSKLFSPNCLMEIEAQVPIRRLGGGYAMLRDIEASVVAQLGRTPSNDELSNNQLGQIWKWIRNPREYSWPIRGLPQSEVLRIDLWGANSNLR